MSFRHGREWEYISVDMALGLTRSKEIQEKNNLYSNAVI